MLAPHSKGSSSLHPCARCARPRGDRPTKPRRWREKAPREAETLPLVRQVWVGDTQIECSPPTQKDLPHFIHAHDAHALAVTGRPSRGDGVKKPPVKPRPCRWYGKYGSATRRLNARPPLKRI